MAIIEYGPLAAEIRGSVGGTTFTRGPYGPVVKQKVAPQSSPTVRREPFRTRISMCTYRWMYTLTQGQRDDWDTLGTNTTFTNSLGQEYNPTGINLYVRTNALFFWIHGTWIDVAPASAIGETVELEYRAFAGPQIQVQLANGVTDAHTIVFWVSAPNNLSRSYHSGPYIFYAPKTTAEIGVWVAVFEGRQFQNLATFFIRRRSIMPDGAIGIPVLEAALRIDL